MCQIFNSSKIAVEEAALSVGNRIFSYNIMNFAEHNNNIMHVMRIVVRNNYYFCTHTHAVKYVKVRRVRLNSFENRLV